MSYIGNQPGYQAFVTDQFNGDGSTTAFSMSVTPAGSTSLLVAIYGVLQDPSTYSVNGTTLTFSAAPPLGTANISVRYLGIPASGVTTTAYRTLTEFTATANQTVFTPPSYTVGYINVFQNGNRLASTDYTATNGTTVVLSTGTTANDLIAIESFYVSSVNNAIPAEVGAVSPSYLAPAGASKAFLDVVNSNGTGALRIPSGTTAQRPTTPEAGDTRYNTTTNQTEIWSGIAWIGVTSQTYTVSILSVAGGGGGGGTQDSGGGGAGGLIYSSSATVSGGSSYVATIGAGGSGGAPGQGTNGANTTFKISGSSFITDAIGGGGGGYYSGQGTAGSSGGSGGGGGSSNGNPGGAGGSGTAGQGYAGGAGVNYQVYTNLWGGGGGGAGAVGTNGSSGAHGGAGLNTYSTIATATATGASGYYAGGGGGGAYGATPGSGGLGGGAAGGNTANGNNATANTGGGGGGCGDSHYVGGNGGSGVLVVFYAGTQRGTGGTVVTTGGYTYHTFTSSGTFTA
jgi:hypothetical protein